MMARRAVPWLSVSPIGRGIVSHVASMPATLWTRTVRTASSSSSSSSSSTTAAGGYQSIGSFHSENLAVLMSLSDQQYVPPKLPFEEEEERRSSDDGNSSPGALFGRGAAIRDDFLLDPSWTFLNHGAFGGALRVGCRRAEAWRRHLERQPLRFFDRDLLPHLAHTGRVLARLVGANDARNVALVPNVTAGLNAALAGYARTFPRSRVILMDTTYGSVKKMVKFYFDSKDTVVHEIPLQAEHLSEVAESSPGEVLERLILRCVEKCRGQPTILLLDHTTSNTALTFPVERLARRAKEQHDQLCVVVDGAHGLLAQDVNFEEMRSVDVYLTNGHKWLSAPRGVAFLHAAPDLHSTVLRQPAVVSHGADEPDLFSRFVWDGCRDYAAALSIPVVAAYWEERGLDRVRDQMKEQLKLGVSVLASYWHSEHSHPDSWAGTVTLTRFDDTSGSLSPMALVALPISGEKTSTDALRIQNQLHDMKIEVPVKCVNGKLYVRVSCHVYNQLDEFECLARAISSLPL